MTAKPSERKMRGDCYNTEVGDLLFSGCFWNSAPTDTSVTLERLFLSSADIREMDRESEQQAR